MQGSGLSGAPLNLQSLFWLQQNAATAVQQVQTMQHHTAQQQQQVQQQRQQLVRFAANALQQQQQLLPAGTPSADPAVFSGWASNSMPVGGAAAGVAGASHGKGHPNAAGMGNGNGSGGSNLQGGTNGTNGHTNVTNANTNGTNGNANGTTAAGIINGEGGYTSGVLANSTWMPSNQLHQAITTPVSAPGSGSGAPVSLTGQQQQHLPAVNLGTSEQHLPQHQAALVYPSSAHPQANSLQLPVDPAAAAVAAAAALPFLCPVPALAGPLGLSAAGIGAAGSSGGSLMGLGTLFPPVSSALTAPLLPGLSPFGTAGTDVLGAAAVAAAAAAALQPLPLSGGSCAAGLTGFWPLPAATGVGAPLTPAATGLVAPSELLPAAAMLQQMLPHHGWADLGATTAAAFNAGVSPSLYWQYLTAAALLAQPPNSTAMINAARAYHYFQQYLASDWMEDRTPSLASSAASEESAKESPAIERADRVSEAGMDEDEDLEQHRSERVGRQDKQAALACTAAAATTSPAAAVAQGAGGGKGLTDGEGAGIGGRITGRKRAAADTDSEQDEASSRRKYR
jgi:hypothetical protein